MIEYIKTHPAIVVTIVTASLYLFGLFSYLSHLSTLGIEETQFQLSIDRLLFQGFVVLFTNYYVLVFKAIIFILAYIVSMVLVGIVLRYSIPYILLDSKK